MNKLSHLKQFSDNLNSWYKAFGFNLTSKPRRKNKTQNLFAIEISPGFKKMSKMATALLRLPILYLRVRFLICINYWPL